MLWYQRLLHIRVTKKFTIFQNNSLRETNKKILVTYIVDRYLYAANLSCLADPYVSSCSTDEMSIQRRDADMIIDPLANTAISWPQNIQTTVLNLIQLDNAPNVI
jgi:hypothetical protein